MSGENVFDSLKFGLLNALRTGDTHLDLLVVALLPTLIALVTTASSSLQPAMLRGLEWLSRLGGGKETYRRVIRVERRHAVYSTQILDDNSNAVLHKALALHLGDCDQLKLEPECKLRLMARGVEKSSGPSWRRQYGNNAKLLEQYTVVRGLEDGEWVKCGNGVRVRRELSEADEEDKGDADGGTARDSSVDTIDYVLECDNDATAIETFIREAYDAYKKRVEESDDSSCRYLYVRTPRAKSSDDDDDEGSGSATRYKRYKLSAAKTFNSLFFAEKERLLNLLDAFRERRGKFAVRGFPKKLGILLHGPPGTGKTSLIKAVAERTKRHIVSINLSRIKTNQELMDSMFDLRFAVEHLDCPVKLSFSQCIFVLEDIDAATTAVHARKMRKLQKQAKKTKGEDDDDDDMLAEDEMDPLMKLITMMTMSSEPSGPENSKSAGAIGKAWGESMDSTDALDLSGVLNVLDGVVDTPDRIIILTTNHPEKLDPALIRPGRIDLQLHLGFLNEPEAAQMVSHYVLRSKEPMSVDDSKAFSDAWSDCRKAQVGMTPAQLEQLCASCDTLQDVIDSLARS